MVQWCWFYNERTKCKQLCRWLGPAYHIGQALCSYILIENGQFITRSSVVGIDDHDLTSLDMIVSCRKFTESVEAKIGNDNVPLYDTSTTDKIYFSDFGENDNADNNLLLYGEEIVDQKESEVNDTVSFNGGILADDVGLGKTLCCLGNVLFDIVNKNPNEYELNTLILLPSRLIGQWHFELNKYLNNKNII